MKNKIKDTMSIKNKKMFSIVILAIISIITLMPLILAYPAALPAYDLYTIFVEAVFGGFWLSVLGLATIMFILMGPLGRLSQFTVMMFCIIFVYAMALGYTQPLILISIWTLLIGWFVYQLFKYINSGSTT